MKSTFTFWAFSLLLLTACSQQKEDFYQTKKANEVELTSDSPTAPVAEKAFIVDEFEQNINTRDIDILWIIDNSRSMTDEQEALAKNFDSFIREFISHDINFRMAVTVTDASPTWKGFMIRNNPELLTSQSLKNNPQTFLDNFSKTVKVGIQGSGDEQGLSAIEGFIDRYADTFFRKNAYLMVVIVSDEEDSSPKPVSEYIGQLQSLKENHGLIKVYSIVDTKNLTNDPTQALKKGFARYESISKATSGKVIDIGQNFSKSLADLGKTVVELVDNFPLKANPIENSLRVYVDEELSMEDTYKVLPASHVLKFLPKAIPASGAKIRAEYSIIK